MPTFFEFRSQISKLVKETKYGDAIKCFKENGKLFSKEEVAGNEYLVSDILTSLRKTNEFDKAILFLKYLGIQISAETKQRTLSSYGWVLYSKLKAESQLNVQAVHVEEAEDDLFDGDEEYHALEENYSVDKSELITKIEELLPLIDKTNDFGYTLYSFLFLSVVKTEKKKPSTNWRFVNEFCDLVNPDDLHTDCKTIKVTRKGQEKDMELASDKEYWYAYKSKALFTISEFQLCYDISKKALEIFDKFHYSNDIWFTRRIALAKKNMGGQSSDAINELLAVLRKKKEWFIQKEIAQLYFEDNKFDDAFKYATQAVLNFGDLEYKVDLIFLIGKILRLKGESELAYKHYYLSKFIRTKETWSVPQKLMDAINELQLPSYPESEFEPLKKELKEYWNSLNATTQQIQKKTFNSKPQQHGRRENKDVVKGKVEKILHNDAKGVDGFIRTQDNRGVYFRLTPELETSKVIKVGIEVECAVLPAKDGKKERAINVKIIK